jgi:hypothetical protein
MSSNNNENNEFSQSAAKHNSKKKMPLWGWAILIIMCLAILKESIHFANSNKSGWSTKRTKDIYNSLNEGLNKMAIDSSSKANLINCTIRKLKDKYPQGMESVNDDSLKNVTAEFISICSEETNISLGWSPTVDKLIRDKLMEAPSMKKLSVENQKIYCNCYINRLKEFYPNGLTENLRESTKDSITIACSKEIKR